MNFKKWYRCVGLSILSFCLVQSVEAWQSHFLLTAPILSNMPEISQNPSVPAETLTAFLEAESEGLVTLLKDIDSWPSEVRDPYSNSGGPGYTNPFPPLPSELVFRGKNDSQRSLLQQFTDRARIHPQETSGMHYDTLFVEYAPGQSHRINNPLKIEDVVLASIADKIPIANPPLEKVNPGELVSAYEIITSAVDEPDFGMDVNLFEDNSTDFGKKYKLRNTPGFTNKDLAIGTQAPFHMGWYHENSWIKGFGPNMKPMYAEYRIHFFITLSRYAFKTGHPYWGCRFLGWAIHYLQDLSQPYHAKLVPGIITAEILISNQAKLKNRVSNLHLALENYQYNLMTGAFTQSNNYPFNQLLLALADKSDDNYQIKYDDLYLRNVVAREAYYHFANTLDDSLVRVFSTVANDIAKDSDGLRQSANVLNFDSIDLDLYSKISQDDPNVKDLNNNLVSIFKSVGLHTRRLIFYALNGRN